MKNIKYILVVMFALWFFFAPVNGTAQTKQAQPQKSSAADQISQFQNSTYWKKLKPSMQTTWTNAMKDGQTDLKLECFVRVRSPADEGDESFLISNGFIVQVFAGSIARGHMKVDDVPDVAALPFVDSIELAKQPQ